MHYHYKYFVWKIVVKCCHLELNYSMGAHNSTSLTLEHDIQERNKIC